MKLTQKILLALLLLLTAGLFASNLTLKKEYDSNDQGDIYFTYGTLLQQPFHHLHITGGNVTQMIFEPAPTASVRVFRDWEGFESGKVKAIVRNDTCYINFPTPYPFRNLPERDYMRWNTLVRIFAPSILSVTATDCNLEMERMKERALSVRLAGKSKFEVESLVPEFDTLEVTARDSSAAVFEMSPENKVKPLSLGERIVLSQLPQERKYWSSFHVVSLHADLQGASILDIGHAQIDSLQLAVSDTSAILLSGGTMRRARSSGRY